MRKRPSHRARGITALAVGLLVACSAQAQQRSGGLIKPGEPPSLELVYTGDVIGYLDPCG